MAASMKQIGRDRWHGTSIKVEGPWQLPLDDMNNGNDNCGESRPSVALACRVDRSPMCANPAQAGVAGVALADGVGGDQAKGALGSQ